MTDMHRAIGAMQRDSIRELVEAIQGQLDIAAARLLADGVAIERLSMWAEQNSTERGMLVDAVKVFTVSTAFEGTTFTIIGVWDEPFAHLADCDKADDAAKVEAMRALVPPPA
jgi:hypothetical protein